MSDQPTGKNIVIGVTGSIAAYKAADLVSHLAKSGHEIHVVMTDDAQEFITPLTLQTLSTTRNKTGIPVTLNWLTTPTCSL